MADLVVIPTYNEVENLEKICLAVWGVKAGAHILIVDDNSQDGTKDIIKKLRQEFPERFFYIERAGKLGLGTAYLAGFRWAIERNYQKLLQMDADFSHPVSLISEMFAALDSVDLAIGSRYVDGGKVSDWSMLRQAISRFGSFYARSILSLRTRDLTGGFNAWKVDVLSRIPLDLVKSEGYSFQIELKYRAQKMGFITREIPIEFKDRRAGKSKMSGAIIVEAMIRVWALRCRV